MIDGLIYFRTKIFEYLEQERVEKVFYPHPEFASLDRALCEAYAGHSPYEVSKEFNVAQGAKEIYNYGETPLTTLNKMVKAFGITSEDRILEMGAGRGRGALFLGEYLGAQVKGVECIPHFVKTFQETIPSSRVEMLEGDMFEVDFSWPTVIYLFGTMLEDEEIVRLAGRFPSGTKILTVSYPLEEYAPEFQIEGEMSGSFPWGKTDIYLNRRVS